MKTCKKCKLPKENSEFYTDKRKKDGLRSWCKDCQKEDNSKREPTYNKKRREYRETHKTEAKLNKKSYYKDNKQTILDSNRNWRQTLPGRLLSYKRAASHRNIEWDLSEEQFTSLWQNPCNYCGEPIPTIGIDRVDNSKGYIAGNVVSCCTLCNTMKMDMSIEQFLQKIKQIYELQRDKG